MVLSLGRLLNVRRAEQARVAWLFGMLFVSVLGCVWGQAVIEAAFLRQIGVRYLPAAIASSAILSIAGITIYNLFADRVANQKLLVSILALGLLGIGTGILLLVQGWVALALPLLYVVDSVLVRDMLNTHWPIYVNGFFDTQSAKRVFPVLSSASRLAAIIGGVTMPVLNRSLPIGSIIAVMLLSQFAMLALVLLMRRALHDRPQAPAGIVNPGSAKANARTNIQEGYRYVAGSRYLRWIAAATLLTMVLLAYLNYESGRLLLADLKTVQAMSNFTALLRGLGNLIALPVQLFLLSRIIGRIGVGNANLIYPSTSLVAIGGLTLVPGLISAGFGYLTRTVWRNTFYFAVDGLLYNAVPLRIKARARGFISGYVMTAGSLLGAILLMFIALVSSREAHAFLAVLFGALALAYLASALQVRRYYGRAVVAMLDQDDYLSLQAPSDAELAVVDDATLGKLAARMAAPDASPELKVFTAQVICQVGDGRAVQVLDSAIRNGADHRLRARLLEVLATSGQNSAAAEEVYVSYLRDPEKDVRRAALTGLEESTADNSARFHGLASPLLADPEPDVQRAALAALVRKGSFYQDPAAACVLEKLLCSDDPASRAIGVRLVGRLIELGEQPAQEALTSRLLGSLSDTDDAVRLAAVIAAEEAAGPPDGLLPEWLPCESLGLLLRDRVERVREGAAGLLGRTGSAETQALLIDALSDSSAAVRSASVESLVRAGPAVADLVRPLLLAKNPRLRATAAAILARVDPTKYTSSILTWCVSDHLQAAYRYTAYRVALEDAAASPALDVLTCALSEQAGQRLDNVFYLVSAIRTQETVDRTAALLHSSDRQVRANATEALEVMTTPQVARLLGALCEAPPPRKRLLALAAATWGWPAPSADQALKELKVNPEEPWLRELAAIAGSSGSPSKEDIMLSAIERVIFLKEVPFFQGMTVEQLRVLANVCEEAFVPEEGVLFREGDPGGTLYVIVSGRVAIEQEKRPGSVARIATVEAHSYLGETDFFDNNCRTNSARAMQDTLTLKLRREPLIALARQYPDLSLELIKVLSERLREANSRIADLTRAHPQKLHKLYDQLG